MTPKHVVTSAIRDRAAENAADAGGLHVDTGEPFGLDADAGFFEYFARDAIGWCFGEF
jgi:hypothetical protein